MVGAPFDEAFEDFVTQRMDDLGSNAPDAVSEVIGQLESCLELLVPTLTEEQKPLWMDMDNALSAQIGEETRYYYRAGFADALQFIFKGMNIEVPEIFWSGSVKRQDGEAADGYAE